jgi:mRNA interferase RelE/StbE
LAGDRTGLWRYRVGDDRMLCQMDDARIVITLIAIGHRSSVYR